MSQEARPTVQKRSQETRDKLIKALEEILREKYFDQITVAEIAERAGVAVGTVYRRFKNKEAFIPVMVEQHRLRQEELINKPEEGLHLAEETTLRQALKELAIFTWKQISRESHVLRTLYLYVRLKPELVSEEWTRLEKRAMEETRMLLDFYKKEIKQPDLEKAARMILYFFNSILIEKGLFSDLTSEWLAEMDGQELAEEMADFAFGYLILEKEN